MSALAACPVVVTVNVDVEQYDNSIAGKAGLFGRYSYGRYGAREGIWRILEVLKVEGVKATFFVVPSDAERHPTLVEAILSGDHEVAAQDRVVDPEKPAEAGRLELLGRARDTLKRLAGPAPKGWRSGNGLVSPEMLPELARLGFLYDSSFQDDDRPYVMDDGKGKRLVELPVFEYLMDATFYAGRHGQDRVRKAWFEEFAAMYEDGCYVNLTLHSRGDTGSARAVRARVVADFLNHVGKQPGVAFARADALAEAMLSAKGASEPFPAGKLVET
jgi:peptidoglycan/xylan/chitin deacetylase (PgdA/CDA1 family)